MKKLPGWTTKISEISNGVFQILLTDDSMRSCDVIADYDQGLDKAIEMAFNMEKDLLVSWSRFLYDLCLFEIADSLTANYMYDQASLITWSIETSKQRIIYLDKVGWMIYQLKQADKWFDINILSKEQLSYSVIKATIRALE